MKVGRNETARKGFTLMEVLTVIVLMGILSAMVVPRFLASQAANALDGEAQTLFNDLAWARLQSNKAQQRHYVVFDSASRGWKIYRENSGNTACDVGADLLVRSHSMETAVQIGFGSNFTSLPGALAAVSNFATTTVVRSGLGPGIATNDDCLEGASTGSGSWNATATACVNRGVPDLETGVVYLSSTRTKTRAVAIVYDDQGATASLQLQRWVWSGSGWRRS